MTFPPQASLTLLNCPSRLQQVLLKPLPLDLEIGVLLRYLEFLRVQRDDLGGVVHRVIRRDEVVELRRRDCELARVPLGRLLIVGGVVASGFLEGGEGGADARDGVAVRVLIEVAYAFADELLGCKG